jgi:hydrogenase maturation protein HypF
MDLEFAIDPNIADSYPFALGKTSPVVIDWEPAVHALLGDRNQPASLIAARFHHFLADVVLAVARRFAQCRVVLSGGCFQNRYLTERVIDLLRREGFQPYWHERVPPNDGGVALGQIYAAISPIGAVT